MGPEQEALGAGLIVGQTTFSSLVATSPLPSASASASEVQKGKAIEINGQFRISPSLVSPGKTKGDSYDATNKGR
jgi:hypothetical protein